MLSLFIMLGGELYDELDIHVAVLLFAFSSPVLSPWSH